MHGLREYTSRARACRNTHAANEHVAGMRPRASTSRIARRERMRRCEARRAARLTDRDCAHLDMRDERYAQRARMTP
ncbi:hypothetical protein [Burkholderia pseudomallei]|uniref:hypothetical protein n=1 Tax=Burkholderia pseudomallei TaxID=28450 RepID=UPI00059BBC7B|nr:hypothetical protein [Burkholderia pseudomallei]